MTCPKCNGEGEPLPDEANNRFKCKNLRCRVFTYTPEYND